MTKRLLIALACLAAFAAPAAAEKRQKAAATDNYDELYAHYLAAARTQPSAPKPDPNGWMNGLMTDSRARQVNDLLTVRIVESITASGAADSSLGKSSQAGVGVPNFFGIEKKLPSALDPTNLASVKSDTGFKGSGATTRAGELSALMTVRVSEVLANGDLVLEGIREVDINGDHQVVVLTGVVRAVDISPGNAVLSTSIGQLRVRYFGRGLMKDSLSPGWLIRVLNKLF